MMRSMLRVAVLAIAVLLVGAAAAGDRIEGPVAASVIRVIDGDTIEVVAEIWPGYVVTTRIRLSGVDTPESGSRARCRAEADRATAATAFVRRLLPPGARVALTAIRPGKYAGRVIASVRLEDGRDLSRLLIAEGLGRPYRGGRRRGWCGAD